MVKQKEQENWQNWAMALAEFCSKPLCIIYAHMSLAGVGGMAWLDRHQWNAKTMPPGWGKTESYMEGRGTTGNIQGKKMCMCVYMFLL